ncbi:GTP 3',8-cyclase MoaA [Catenovulum sp. SM1970]|uniref:GTP 3',8-cyclase MoaA n=1 Tax=Marinifaba aquimaris TaxID=2741323 RepID=UPI00157379E8|nr:GTP 3',8-cyclase MoaA [Marinifaba aquimaris]NTS76209.1 GTP 3',8-cyclase MoaA [Marinifaba aquimaris]
MLQDNVLQDSFGRRFEYLRLSITDVCNFKCNYCLPDGYDCDGDRDFLSLAEIQTLVSAFAELGMRKIRITGGEPALRKDLTDIIALCKATPGIEQVALTTNGFNLDKKIDEFVSAGLDALNVSVDSLDPRMFAAITGHEKLEIVLDGATRALELGIDKVKFNAVLLKQFNASQFNDYLNWIKQRPITLRFIELMETGDNKVFFDANHVQGGVLKKQLLAQGWLPVIRNKLSGPAEEFFHPDYQGRIGLIMPYSKDFCKNCNRLRVSSKGQLHLCLFTEQGVDLRPALLNQDIAETKTRLVAAMDDKVASHFLTEHKTGVNKHFASIGG